MFFLTVTFQCSPTSKLAFPTVVFCHIYSRTGEYIYVLMSACKVNNNHNVFDENKKQIVFAKISF